MSDGKILYKQNKIPSFALTAFISLLTECSKGHSGSPHLKRNSERYYLINFAATVMYHSKSIKSEQVKMLIRLR